MDTNRITQIFQDLITEETNCLSKLNEFLREALNNPGPTAEEHQALKNRVAELEVQNSQLQEEIQRLQTELTNENLDDEARTNQEIESLKALSDSFRSSRDNLQSVLEKTLAEIKGALDNLSKETSGKSGPYSDGYYKDGKIDTSFSTPFTSVQSGPDTFEVTTPLLALDDNLYYSYTDGVSKPYSSQIVLFLPDGTPQTLDNGNWGYNYIPQTPLPMQTNDGKWFCFPGGSVVPVEDSETPIAIQKIGPRAGDYDVYYTFKYGVGTVADGVYSNGTFSNGLLQ